MYRASVSTALLAPLLFAFSSSAATANTPITWAAFVYTFYGEKVPVLQDPPFQLTPYGANQLVDAGSLIRDRYISSNSTNSSSPNSGPIHGISQLNIDNDQLNILSTTDSYVVQSAEAFMQGLYPPAGAVVDAESVLSNGNLSVFPLNGYQYPNIGTPGLLDYNYIWAAGNQECTAYGNYQSEVTAGRSFQAQVNDSTSFYNRLYPIVFSGLSQDLVSYTNAYALYEYALYQYNHNSSVAENLQDSDLYELAALAAAAEVDFNVPSSDSFSSAVPPISGLTLNSYILQQFRGTTSTAGNHAPLTLLFGSYEPMLAFFALTGLSGSTGALSEFNSLPLHGSMMVFELFSYPETGDGGSEVQSQSFPAIDSLWVRFLFRNGTDDAELLSYPLFGRGNDEADMSWVDFADTMSRIALSNSALSGARQWCDVCQTANLFCTALVTEQDEPPGGSSSSSGSRKGLAPAIAGVIGATVTLATVILVALVFGLLGFRIEHLPRSKGSPSLGVVQHNPMGPSGGDRGSGGGFKGPVKQASDPDLTTKVGPGGAIVRHERVGSWELKDSPIAGPDPDSKHDSLDRVVSTADYGRQSEDGMHTLGDPVKPYEQV